MENFTCEDITDDIAKHVMEQCSRLPTSEIRFANCALPKVYKEYAQQIIDFEVRSDDIWVLSYPKCGTTWTQEMVWLLGNNCDFETAKNVTLFQRFPFMEFIAIGGNNSGNTIEKANNMKSPRFIKCHLPVHLLPKQIWTKKPKMVYVYRDPRDVVVSYFHHMQLWYNYSGTMDKFIDAFLQGVLPYDPFWNHIIKFWELRNEPNMCFNTFEDMKKDLGSIINKTSGFLGIKISEENKSKLLEHLSFNSMKNNTSVNYKADKDPECKFQDVQFIREGKSGGWKSKLSADQIAKFDDLAKTCLANVDFPYYKFER